MRLPMQYSVVSGNKEQEEVFVMFFPIQWEWPWKRGGKRNNSILGWSTPDLWQRCMQPNTALGELQGTGYLNAVHKEIDAYKGQ